MYGAIEQVGQTLICPDCGTPAVVPPPCRPPKPAAPPIVADVYALHNETPAAGRRRAAEEALIRLTCLQCGTMMYATADQVGGKLACPDCGTSVVIPPPPPPRRKIDVMAGRARATRLPAGTRPRPARPAAAACCRPVAAEEPAGVQRTKIERQFTPYVSASDLASLVLPYRDVQLSAFARVRATLLLP